MAKILVVDDVEVNISLLQFNLEDDNHEVISANNGQECLDKAQHDKPDLILLDMMMPKMSGLETLRRLKQDAQLSHIPVMMVSANDGDDNIIESLDIGAHDYISKPFIYPVLSARLRSALRLKESQESLASANTALSRLASLDPLTEIYNRRYFFELSKAEFAKARRYDRNLSVIMLDIDHFKHINDTYGHAFGDRALIEMCHLCKIVGRESDIFGRLGGEEFAFCCPDTDLNGAIAIGNRIRAMVEQLTIESDKEPVRFTVSLGITTLREKYVDFESVLNRADQLLYQAKDKGRNCIVSEYSP